MPTLIENVPPSTPVGFGSRPAPRRGWLAAFIVALRPKQWTKNGLLFVALLFTADQGNRWVAFSHACLGFAIFSLLSGVAYLINDVVDCQSDRQHPIKRNRPIAAGELSPGGALVAAAILGAVCIALAYGALNFKFGLAASAYLAATISYSLIFKHVVILDLLVLAFGFVLRAVAGAWAIPVGISAWLVLCALLLALFLGIEKRRGELLAVIDGRKGGRPIISEYSADMLNQMSTIVTSALLMSYALYTIQSDTARKHHYLMVTIPFVLYGIFRYLYLVHRHRMGESPDDVLIKDKPLLINILLWAVATVLIVLHPLWH